MGTLANVKVKPMNFTFGDNVYQIATVTCRADVSKDLNNDWFALYTPAGVGHYFWFNVNSEGSDPSIAGFTGHAVAVATNATAAAVATALEAVVDSVTGFNSEVSGAVVTITNTDYGYAQGPHEGAGTEFSFEVTSQGCIAEDIGFIDGDIEVSIAEDLVDITAHQTGTNILSQIRTGKQVEITLNIKETSKNQLKKVLLGMCGGFTPAGASGTEVFGAGTHKDFTQTYSQAYKLTGHPVTLGSGDHSEDITFFKAYPIIDSLTFSGENIQTVPVTFKVYPYFTNNDRVEYFAIGDATQTLT